jgi:hypothetical protein
MAKKKTNQQQLKKSEDALIIERARKLPIYKCYISIGWKEAGMASIIVLRQHVNKNVTVGFFQVDLLLKGVKDAFCRFNLPMFELQEILDDDSHIETGYNLVHNIIYGSVEYAGEYGFYPHKGWKTAQYVLEEDTEEIPLMDIEFGKNGKPTLVDTDGSYLRDVQTLERTVGKGNFHFIENLDVDDDDQDDGAYEEDNETISQIIQEDFLEHVPEKYRKSDKGIAKLLNKMDKTGNGLASMALINKIYYNAYGVDHFMDIDVMDYAIGDIELTSNKEEQAEIQADEDFFNRFKKSNDFVEIVRKYPYSYNAMFIVSLIMFVDEKSKEQLVEKFGQCHKEWPDSLPILEMYLMALTLTNDKNTFFQLINDSGYVEKILVQKELNEISYLHFCIIRSHQFLFEDNLAEADRYYMATRVISKIKEHPLVFLLADKLSAKKLQFLLLKTEELESQMGQQDG